MTTQFESTVKRMKPKSLRMFSEGKVGARLATYANGIEAVMKVAHPSTMKGERSMQNGIPTAKIPSREVAFYKLSRLFGFNVVPETVLGTFEGHATSFQQYMSSAKLYDVDPRLRHPKRDKEAWSIALREVLRDSVQLQDTVKLTLLDFIACSRDRHAANYGAALDIDQGKARWRLIGWDNGCAFGLTQEKYHCVAHKHLFRHSFDLSSVWKQLQKLKRSELIDTLVPLITEEAAGHVWLRVQFILTFPHRMPWVTLSEGSDEQDAFPSYAEWFRPLVERQLMLQPSAR